MLSASLNKTFPSFLLILIYIAVCHWLPEHDVNPVPTISLTDYLAIVLSAHDVLVLISTAARHWLPEHDEDSADRGDLLPLLADGPASQDGGWDAAFCQVR